MCILFVYTDPQPPSGGYRLIVASNRDEFYRRPAKKAFNCPETNIIGGRDMEPGREGGMWLGLSTKQATIKVGTLLNVTGEQKMNTSLGRGPLVYDYLKTNDNALDFVKTLNNQAYSAFNLCMIEVTTNKSITYHHSNRPEATLEYNGKQVLAFGNSTPDAPFTKVKMGKQRFENIIRTSQDKNQLIEQMLELLKWHQPHLPDPELERRAPAGIGFLSSVFVKMENGGYGTRTHSVILVDDECNIDFVEHTMSEPIDAENPQWEVTHIKSRL